MATKKRRKKGPRRDLYQEVTDAVIEQLEQGTAPWVRPWAQSGGVPRAALTGREYQGVNVLFLGIMQAAHGYSTPLWGTLRSFAKLLAMPTISDDTSEDRRSLKGQKSTPVTFVNVKEKVDPDTGEKVFRAWLGHHGVFNLDQVTDLTLDERARILERRGIREGQASFDPIERDSRCESIVASLVEEGAAIVFRGEQACYRWTEDVVYMPEPDSFVDGGAYYATMFHELGHWTGHKSRLNRDIQNGFGTSKYAFEELVAELTSAFVCARTQVDGMLQHSSYIAHWLKRLKEDKKFIFKASSAASKAANLIVEPDLGEDVVEQAA